VCEIILTALSWVNIENVIFTEEEFNKNEVVHFLVVGLFIHPYSHYLYLCDLHVSQADTPVFMGCMGPAYHDDVIVLENYIVICKHRHAQHSNFRAHGCTTNKLLTRRQLL